jgi:hypothetical protein
MVEKSVQEFLPSIGQYYELEFVRPHGIKQWYSTFFVRVLPDIISLQLCTPKVVGT